MSDEVKVIEFEFVTAAITADLESRLLENQNSCSLQCGQWTVTTEETYQARNRNAVRLAERATNRLLKMGVTVLRLNPLLLNQSGIAARLSVSRAAVSKWVDSPGFPAPRLVSASALYDWELVNSWLLSMDKSCAEDWSHPNADEVEEFNTWFRIVSQGRHPVGTRQASALETTIGKPRRLAAQR